MLLRMRFGLVGLICGCMVCLLCLLFEGVFSFVRV